MAGAIEALFASINPHVSDDVALARNTSRVLHEVASAKIATSARILRSTFESIQAMFDRVRKEERNFVLEATAITDLKSLLFGSSITIQAIRLLRAQAVLAAVTSSPALVKEMESDIRASVGDEPSLEVRQVLDSAVQP